MSYQEYKHGVFGLVNSQTGQYITLTKQDEQEIPTMTSVANRDDAAQSVQWLLCTNKDHYNFASFFDQSKYLKANDDLSVVIASSGAPGCINSWTVEVRGSLMLLRATIKEENYYLSVDEKNALYLEKVPEFQDCIDGKSHFPSSVLWQFTQIRYADDFHNTSFNFATVKGSKFLYCLPNGFVVMTQDSSLPSVEWRLQKRKDDVGYDIFTNTPMQGRVMIKAGKDRTVWLTPPDDLPDGSMYWDIIPRSNGTCVITCKLKGNNVRYYLEHRDDNSVWICDYESQYSRWLILPTSYDRIETTAFPEIIHQQEIISTESHRVSGVSEKIVRVTLGKEERISATIEDQFTVSTNLSMQFEWLLASLEVSIGFTYARTDSKTNENTVSHETTTESKFVLDPLKKYEITQTRSTVSTTRPYLVRMFRGGDLIREFFVKKSVESKILNELQLNELV